MAKTAQQILSEMQTLLSQYQPSYWVAHDDLLTLTDELEAALPWVDTDSTLPLLQQIDVLQTEINDLEEQLEGA